MLNECIYTTGDCRGATVFRNDVGPGATRSWSAVGPCKCRSFDDWLCPLKIRVSGEVKLWGTRDVNAGVVTRSLPSQGLVLKACYLNQHRSSSGKVQLKPFIIMLHYV